MFLFRCCCPKKGERKLDGSTATTESNTRVPPSTLVSYPSSIMKKANTMRQQKQESMKQQRISSLKELQASFTTLLPSTRAVLVYPRIVIVGGGIAGIACAVDLVKKGYNVHILEAGNRLGGRIHTVSFADNVVDLGAQWCHGETDNVVYKMVKRLNLIESSGDMYIDFECIRSNGDVVPDDIVLHLKEVLGNIFIRHRSEMTNYDGSLANFLHEKFYAAVNGSTFFEKVDRNIIMEFFENFKKIETSDCGPTLDEVSARGFLDYWECEGDYTLNWKNFGFGELINVMTKAEKLKSRLGVLESKVHFDTTVEKIHWSCDDAVVRVKCEGISEPLEVDSVVVTVSLGVLKRRVHTMFEPQLPPDKLSAIEAIGYGDICKIFIEFEKPFWPPDWNGFCTLWREQDLMEMEDDTDNWITDIYGFYRIPYQPRILLAWVVGANVKIIETLSSSVIQNQVVRVLRKFLKKWKIPEPKNVLVSDWSTNNNFYGSYSFRTLNTEAVKTGAAVLSQPLTLLATPPKGSMNRVSNDESNVEGHHIERPTMSSNQSQYIERFTLKPVLLFAGEATSLHHFSTVHGALESGRREAARLVGYYENENLA